MDPSLAFARRQTVPPERPGNYATYYGSPYTNPRDLDPGGRDTMASASLNGYEASAAINTLLAAWWRMVSSVPWIVELRRGQEWDREEGHEHETLIEYPNKEETRQYQMAQRALHLGLSGETISSKIFLGKKTEELWVLNPDKCTQKMRGDYRVDYWEVIEGSEPKRYEKAQICHAKFPHPRNPTRGMPPWRAAKPIVEMDRAQLKANAESAKGGNRFPAIYTLPQDPGQPALNEMKDRARERFSDPSKVNEPLFATGGATIQAAAWSAKEIDYLNSRGFSFIELCRLYWMPHALFDSGAQTYDNFATARLMAWEDAAVTVLNTIGEALNLSLVPWEQRRDVWITYDLSQVPALKEKAAEIRAKNLEAHERAIGNGVPVNESFVLLDLQIPPQSGGDKAMLRGVYSLLEDVTSPLGSDYPPALNPAPEPPPTALNPEPERERPEPAPEEA